MCLAVNEGLTPARLSLLLVSWSEQLVDGQEVENCCWEVQAPEAGSWYWADPYAKGFSSVTSISCQK